MPNFQKINWISPFYHHSGNPILKGCMKKMKISYEIALKSAKQKNFNTIHSNSSNTTKTSWNIGNEKVGKNKRDRQLSLPLLMNPQTVVENFRFFFVNPILNTLRTSIVIPSQPVTVVKTNPNSFYYLHCSEKDGP